MRDKCFLAAMVFQNLRPMRLSRRLEPFDSDEYLYELKIDGFRALAHIVATTLSSYRVEVCGLQTIAPNP
jgi:ATP-dependent DNA ligase